MKKRPIIKSITHSHRNKTLFNRAGISAGAYMTPVYAHTLAVFPDALQASTFIQDTKALFPERNIYLLNELPLNSETDGLKALLLERGETIRRWIDTKGILAAYPGSLMASCMLGSLDKVIKRSEKFNLVKLREWLDMAGYKRSSLVWSPGQYVQRGFILDVYDPGYALPLRFEFFDDELERIGSFHPDTQKSSKELMHLEEITLHGINQAVIKFPSELLPEDTITILFDPDKIESQSESFSWLWNEIFIQAGINRDIDTWPKVYKKLSEFPVVRISNDPDKSDAELPIESLPAFKGDPKIILGLCDELQSKKFTVSVYTNNPIFAKLPYEIHDSLLSSGFIDTRAKHVFISERELAGITSTASLTQRRPPNEWNDSEKLSPGQLVIHEDYGTGIFRGIETVDSSGVPMDMLAIEFANDNKLLIPVLHSHKLTGLNEHESEAVKLDTLKGKAWKKNAQKTQERARQEAEELMKIFAQRELQRREPFPEPDDEYNDFVKAFQFNETADQLKATDEIMKDLSGIYPMDRLLVGDVGFGKTEVAMRAAFRVIEAGYQVCILVPTTILAQQHYVTFQSRFAGFPIRIGLLSRFISRREAVQIMSDTALGKIDILIGTHKLLQKGVLFKKLGLLVIDEEHRFGVMHKESLKKTYGSVDILSLSATPIPRTLAMSLRGLRSISVLSTPPEDRLPVTTYTGKFEPGTIRRAITYELNRGGQVYFLSNKISRMPEYERMLKAFFPDASIKKAHGQMPEKELEETMLEFYDGKIDILIATTIIESGLDVGRANTILVDNAEELGLAQMYQLRGRVGRRGEKAFAYFFYFNKAELNQDTIDRLDAIATMTDLGSGYDIAMRDLDIRGGGDIAGTSQHGATRNSSYNIYYSLLEKELNKLRGIEEEKVTEIDSDRGGGFIPENYIPQDDVRVTIYRRMINAVGHDEYEALLNEINDRFGKMPSEVSYLVGLTAIRNFGGHYGIEKVNVKKGMVSVKHNGKDIPDFMKAYLKMLGRNVKYIA
ncbi:MAG: DEAD/DEAH box helicase [Synergistaceae bacterium]|nr:DEAD/DEAH box helicase [Synergistaceae bacterium]